MTIAEEARSRNFSIYAQWCGVLSLILCFALGIANFFSFSILIIWGIIALVFMFLIIFVEIPLLLRICPTSAKFDTFMRGINTNPARAGFYLVMAITMWLSLIAVRPNTMIVPAVFLSFTCIFYGLATIKGQEFTGSKTLGGHGVAQMIV